MRAVLFLALAAGLAVALAACGKKGPPSPAGPPAAIIYPKTYPTPEPFPTRPAVAPLL